MTSTENAISSLQQRIEQGFINVQERLNKMQLTQDQEEILKIGSNLNRLWMSYLKYCRNSKNRHPKNDSLLTPIFQKL